MADLYNDKMASIYDAMYQTFINYTEEYNFYRSLLEKHHCQSVLEIGSGTGNLAKFFSQNSFNYIGLDVSEDMIAIAQKRTPKSTFIHGDMREFTLENPVDSILITGRSTSYLISNEDVYYCFESIHQNLNHEGIFVFDFIDANRYIPYTENHKNILHEANCDGIIHYRDSNWKLTTSDNFLMEWTATYYTLLNNEKEVIAEDFSTVRVFTLNEIQLFLYMKGFEILEIIDRKTYAYDTYVIVAKKKKI
ncbi:class I SAM-dependent methyltransferase [Flavobacterium sp.]|uniref:class I SAM-dependent DNA methyltransferase n=1 Tax=Flavobacterium sp. TaxID=239 RepID=UPI0022C324D0|nr:class I SAM-dependent methyltransferase [Flavobacterium sp.]MCZ8228740.1 class I SAM-dependent methyltransferase [Flavobacterium sp.]